MERLVNENEDARWFRINYYNNLSRRSESQFIRKLTLKEIIDGFPDECRDIIPKKIREIVEELEDLRESKAIIKNRALLYFTREYAEELSGEIMPKAKMSHLESLKSIHKILTGLEDNGKFTNEQIEKARKVDIRTLYAFEKPRDYNNRFVALCPFHKENTGSFMIFPRGNYNCFGCGKKGNNAIDFIMELNRLKFNEAVKSLLGNI